MMRTASDWMSKNRKEIATSVCIVLGVLVSCVISSLTGNVAGRGLQTMGLKAETRAIAEKHLDWVNDEMAKAGEQEHQPLIDFFLDARRNARGFAEEALSWNSKWKLATDFVTNNGEHARFLRERFETLVFSQDQLEDSVKQVVQAFLRRLGDVESQMLVRLKADLANLPEGATLDGLLAPEVNARLDSAIRDAAVASQADLGGTIGREIASFIAGEIITHAALQLATSTGILGTGTLSGPATFGISVIVGLIVDQIISEIYEQAFDPVGQLADQLDHQLFDIGWLIVNGTPDSPGLIQRLGEMLMKRDLARREAILNALAL